MKRLQGKRYHKRKKWLVPVGYSQTKAGNICVYFKGDWKHYLNDEEKLTFNPEGLKEFSQEEVEKMLGR